MVTSTLPAPLKTPAPQLVRARPTGRDDSAVVLSPFSWSGYASLRGELADGAARLTYLDGELEIAVPGKRHEELKKLAGALIEMVLNRKRVPFAALGSTTLFREDSARGLEADDCYVLGPAAALVRGKASIDLTVDPPPDLAIEVEVTSGLVNKLAVYAGLGVPELWRVDGAGGVALWRLTGDGTYARSDASGALPELSPAVLSDQLRQLDSLGHSGVVWQFEDLLIGLVKRP